MEISYKFWYVTREDDGHITEAAIRFYEGEEKDVERHDIISGGKVTERRYVRTKRLTKQDVPELDGIFRMEADGSEARVYTKADFGDISTNDELRLFLNREISKHKGRTPQKDQAETSDITKVK